MKQTNRECTYCKLETLLLSRLLTRDCMIDSNKKHCICIVLCIILIVNTVEISPERKTWIRTKISSTQKYADQHWLKKVKILLDLDLCLLRNKALGMGQSFRKGSSSLKLLTLKNTFFLFLS